MPEPPLTDRELRILRGVIDEHLYREARGRFLGESWREGRAILVVVAGVVLARGLGRQGLGVTSTKV